MGAPLRTDVHQHLWPAELLEVLAARAEPPFARHDGASWRLHVPGEPPSAIVAQAADERAASLAPDEAAPLHGERAAARGGPAVPRSPHPFYDTSSYGPDAIAAISTVAGARQLVHGSDIPVLDASTPNDDARVRENPERLLG
jgi:hypothetical protein